MFFKVSYLSLVVLPIHVEYTCIDSGLTPRMMREARDGAV